MARADNKRLYTGNLPITQKPGDDSFAAGDLAVGSIPGMGYLSSRNEKGMKFTEVSG